MKNLVEQPFVNLYATLFLNSSASDGTIVHQAKLLSSACHPDRYTPSRFSIAQRETATTQYIAILHARDSLVESSGFRDFYNLVWWRELEAYDSTFEQQASLNSIRDICPAWKPKSQRIPPLQSLSQQSFSPSIQSFLCGLYIVLIILLIVFVRPKPHRFSIRELPDCQLIDLRRVDIDLDTLGHNRDRIPPFISRRGVIHLSVPSSRRTRSLQRWRRIERLKISVERADTPSSTGATAGTPHTPPSPMPVLELRGRTVERRSTPQSQPKRKPQRMLSPPLPDHERQATQSGSRSRNGIHADAENRHGQATSMQTLTRRRWVWVCPTLVITVGGLVYLWYQRTLENKERMKEELYQNIVFG